MQLTISSSSLFHCLPLVSSLPTLGRNWYYSRMEAKKLFIALFFLGFPPKSWREVGTCSSPSNPSRRAQACPLIPCKAAGCLSHRSFASQCLLKYFYKASSIHNPCLRLKQVQHLEVTPLMSPSCTNSQLPAVLLSHGETCNREEHWHLGLTSRSFLYLFSAEAWGECGSLEELVWVQHKQMLKASERGSEAAVLLLEHGGFSCSI